MWCRTAEQVARTISRLSARTDTVSFDVFDTLISRGAMPPEWTKIPAGRRLHRILAKRGIEVSVQEAMAARLNLEAECRRNAAQNGCDGEYRIEAVLAGWVQLFLSPPEADLHWPGLLEEEIGSHLAVCRPCPGMVEMVRYARSLGKRVFAVSDMYLGEKHIRRLLEHCGYGGLFDGYYVSCDHYRAKATGRLYMLMMEREKVEPRCWIHFGDRIRADFAPPRRLGGASFLYLPVDSLRQRSQRDRLAALETRRPEWIGAGLAVMAAGHRNPDNSADLKHQIGFWILGPLICLFVHWVIERIARNNIELALFPARDGFVFLEVYNRLKRHVADVDDVPTRYCFLNRKTAFPASVRQIGPREIWIGLQHSKRRSLKTLLTRFDCDPEAFHHLVRTCGFESIDEAITDPAGDSRLKRFLEYPEVLRTIKERQQEQKSVLGDYLGDLGFWDANRVALIDVGWHGTVQDSLAHAFGDREDWPPLFGYYLVYCKDTNFSTAFPGERPFWNAGPSSYEGFIYHQGRDAIQHHHVSDFSELLEMSVRAPHPTVRNLVRDTDTGKILPVFADDPLQGRQAHSTLVTGIQAGIFDFVREYERLIPYMEFPPRAHVPFFRGILDRFLRLPRTSEGRLFAALTHDEDFGMDRVWRNPRAVEEATVMGALKEAVKGRALWREGAVAATGLAGAVELYNILKVLFGRTY